jgi:hypothetical protein
MVVPSIADGCLPNCTTESSRRRPVKGDSFVADKPREWSDKQLGDRVSSLRNFDLVANGMVRRRNAARGLTTENEFVSCPATPPVALLGERRAAPPLARFERNSRGSQEVFANATADVRPEHAGPGDRDGGLQRITFPLASPASSRSRCASGASPVRQALYKDEQERLYRRRSHRRSSAAANDALRAD